MIPSSLAVPSISPPAVATCPLQYVFPNTANIAQELREKMFYEILRKFTVRFYHFAILDNPLSLFLRFQITSIEPMLTRRTSDEAETATELC